MKHPENKNTALKDILSTLKQFPYSLVGLFLLSSLAYILMAIPPIYMGRVTDTMIQSGELDVLSCLIMGLTSLLGFGAETLQSHVTSSLSRSFLQEKYLNLMDLLLRKERKLFEKIKIGELIDVFSRYINGFESMIIQVVSSLLPSLLAILVLTTTIYFVGNFEILLWVTLIHGSFSLLIWFFLSSYSQKIQHYTQSCYELSDQWVELLGENKIIQSHHSFKYILHRLKNYVQKMTHALVAKTRSSDFIRNLTSFSHFFSTLILLLILLTYLKKGHITVGEILTLLTLSTMIHTQLGTLSHFALSLRDFKAYHGDFQKTQQARSYLHPGTKQSSKDFSHITITPHTVKKNQTKILHIEKPLTIRKGEQVCVLGISGAGKTTLLSHFFHSHLEYQPYVLINHTPTSQLPSDAVQDLISLCFQENHILSGGHKDWLQKELTSEEQRSAQELLTALRLPQDLISEEKKLDPYGTNISGGEAKRLNVGRSLFEIKEVHVFDEPTTGLNPALSKKVWDLIFEKTQGKTLICSAHDLSYLEHFQRVIIVDEGKIAADTTPPELSQYEVFKKISLEFSHPS